jgi:hypothetical protein
MSMALEENNGLWMKSGVFWRNIQCLKNPSRGGEKEESFFTLQC